MRREDRRRARAMTAIQEHLAQEGVNEIIGQFIEEFNQQPGEKVALGITLSGIVLGVRQGGTGPGDLSAWVLDSTLPPERIVAEKIAASHLIYDYYQDGGTIEFPGSLEWEDFRKMDKMTEQQALATFPPEFADSFRLFRKINSFSIAPPNRPGEPSYIHEQRLFGLELQK